MSFRFVNFLNLARLPQCIAIYAALTLVSAATTGTEAALRKDVSEYAGKRCNTPPRGSDVIVGIFQGLGDSTFISRDQPETISRYRCFRTMDECKGWLYTMQSLYSAGLPRTARCVIR